MFVQERLTVFAIAGVNTYTTNTFSPTSPTLLDPVAFVTIPNTSYIVALGKSMDNVVIDMTKSNSSWPPFTPSIPGGSGHSAAYLDTNLYIMTTPVAIINFISKTGLEQGGVASLSLGTHEFRRYEFGYGGNLGPKTRFYLGGHYRTGNGALGLGIFAHPALKWRLAQLACQPYGAVGAHEKPAFLERFHVAADRLERDVERLGEGGDGLATGSLEKADDFLMAFGQHWPPLVFVVMLGSHITIGNIGHDAGIKTA